MSYQIERAKRVLRLKTDDTRFTPCLGDTLIYLMESASNNVTPRTYGWDVVATGNDREWNNEIQLPREIWEMGHAADGGGIKVGGRHTPGLAYVRQWKKAAGEAVEFTTADGSTMWKPSATIWVGGYSDGQAKAEAIEAKGEAVFGEYGREQLFQAFRRLFPHPIRGGRNYAETGDLPRVLDALFLYQRRKDLPFSIYLTTPERDRFLTKPVEVAQLR